MGDAAGPAGYGGRPRETRGRASLRWRRARVLASRLDLGKY
jgi:hypothetical protein